MIIFLYGPDDFRSHRMLNEMKEKFVRDVDKDACSLSVIDGEATSLKEIAEKINTGSLFVKKRLVVISNIFKNKKSKIFSELSAYLAAFKQGDDNIIIFIDGELGTKEKPLKADMKPLFNFLAGQKYSQEFKTLSNLQLLSFMKKEAATYQKEMTAGAASKLINLTQGDLWLISSEIHKLASYASDSKITEEDVDTLSQGAVSEDIFAFTDALSSKNRSLAYRLLEEQYAAGLEDEYLLAMLTRQFRILTQIKVSLDKGENPAQMASSLKLHPFVLKKGTLQARNFTLAKLKGILNRLISLDYDNKSGRSHIKTELMLLIGEL